MPLFRFHRGVLDESLQTTVIVKNIIELKDIIKKSHESWMTDNFNNFEVIIEPYPTEDQNFDERIGWYTQIVTSDIHKKGYFKPEGFLSEPLLVATSKVPCKCPVCDGKKYIQNEVEPRILKLEFCIVCDGTGIVWG